MKIGPVGKPNVPGRHTERERETVPKIDKGDMTNLMLAFPNFANDHKNYFAPQAVCNRELLIVLFKIDTIIIIISYFY
jgi:hypothetical protein